MLYTVLVSAYLLIAANMCRVRLARVLKLTQRILCNTEQDDKSLINSGSSGSSAGLGVSQRVWQ